jgi:hypothetical protein
LVRYFYGERTTCKRTIYSASLKRSAKVTFFLVKEKNIAKFDILNSEYNMLTIHFDIQNTAYERFLGFLKKYLKETVTKLLEIQNWAFSYLKSINALSYNFSELKVNCYAKGWVENQMK